MTGEIAALPYALVMVPTGGIVLAAHLSERDVRRYLPIGRAGT